MPVTINGDGAITGLVITTADLANSSVTTAKIADVNVTTAKIADSAVTTAKIAAGAVATVDIADNAVTVAKLAQEGTTGQVLTSNGAGVNPSYQTISTTPTTAQVLTATAGASAGAVGTYVLAGDNGAVTTSFGSTRAGSSLVPIGFGKPGQTNGARPWNYGPSGTISGPAYVGDGYSPALSGTWRAMGNSKYYPSICGTDVMYPGTLWLRIS